MRGRRGPDQVETNAAAVGSPREAAGIPFAVRRSDRARRLRLTVTSDGDVVVTVPRRAALHLADELVAARAPWITRHVDRFADERARREALGPLGEGRVIDYRGVPHRLEVRDLPADRRLTRVERDASTMTLRVWAAPGDARPLAVVLEAWLRREARGAIEDRVATRARDLGVSPARIQVRDQRSRWGSASRRGSVSFSWRLVHAPPVVLDYVVVHELAHLVDFSHSTRFWSIVRGALPEMAVARRWLRDHARELHHSLD
jgi:predicted metal-dependent hydrolase